MSTGRALNSRAWRKISRAVLAQHVAQYGWRCRGWMCPPHGSTDLTVDHVDPRARGATRTLDVLCRSCNSAKRDAHPVLAAREYRGGGGASRNDPGPMRIPSGHANADGSGIPVDYQSGAPVGLSVD